jgi:asparagine synthase (glutamine-hydrolysing)
MCGIAGILSERDTDLSIIRAMTDVQSHRGPDGAGFALVGSNQTLQVALNGTLPSAHGHLALGHRRLAIIDTSSAGLQPFVSTDEHLAMVYNGEVYNYVELRQELEASGVQFRTATDSEVVLEAYRKWGTDCFSRFNGMWALAIWDKRQGRLVLSRDRFGIKPLHLTQHEGKLYFASEIKALLTLPGLPRRLNKSIAADFLRWGTVNHTQETFFQGIMAFPPGHFASIDMSQAPVPMPVAFWRPPSADRLAARSVSAADAEEEFRTLFASAVDLRLRSDVPVGACLSGGLDSSAIVCKVAEGLPKNHRLATFTSASTDPAFDERNWSDLVIEKCGTEPHTVFPAEQGFGTDLDALILTQEEPFPTASIYAQYLLMKSARDADVPVLLDGQGADEALCGYRKYLVYALLESAKQNQWGGFLSGLTSLAIRGDRGLLRLSEGVRYLPSFLRRGNADPMGGVVQTEFLDTWNASSPGSTLTTYRSSERQIDDLLRFSVPPLLRYEDRNSMAWSIESRVPFLDFRLVEYLLELPTKAKISKGQTKALMRNALRGLVPDAILDRRDKMGFVTAQNQWMRGSLGKAISGAFRAPDFALGALVDAERAETLLSAEGYWAGASLNAAFRIFILNRWAQLHNVDIG